MGADFVSIKELMMHNKRGTHFFENLRCGRVAALSLIPVSRANQYLPNHQHKLLFSLLLQVLDAFLQFVAITLWSIILAYNNFNNVKMTG